MHSSVKDNLGKKLQDIMWCQHLESEVSVPGNDGNVLYLDYQWQYPGCGTELFVR